MSKELLRIAIKSSLEAAKEILKIYHSDDFNIELKSDCSPLTKADLVSHQIISSYLKKSKIPILSEEGKDIAYEERKGWSQLWIVDPIDGTKEFIKRNGEFTVNISLILNKKPVLGIIFAPDLDSMFFAIKNNGCFELDNNNRKQLKVMSSDKKIKVIGSRSHQNEKLDSLLGHIGEYEYVGSGSSLKFCMIANNTAHIYPRFSPTSEWDTAAGQAIVEESGGKVLNDIGETLSYNSKESLRNPNFVAFGNIDSLVLDNFYKVLK